MERILLQADKNHLSRVMRQPAFCICKKKGADQLLAGYRTADQHFCFRYIHSTIPLITNPLDIFCGCTARFVLDLVRSPEYRFSYDGAHMFL